MRIFFIILAISLLVAVDFLAKNFFHWPFQNIFLDGNLYGYFPIFGEIFGIQLIYNTGIAFGLPITGNFLKILTLAIILVLWYYYVKHEFPKKNFYVDASFVCIFAGALAHAYERIFIGYVIDFLALQNFAIFNFADIYITFGGIILFVYSFFYEWK